MSTDKILVTESSEVLYSDTQRTAYFDCDDGLSARISYPAIRSQPEINLFLNSSPDLYAGAYIAQGQYKWHSNCSHLLYDVLSDHFVIRTLTGSNLVIHKVTALSSQVLAETHAQIIQGEYASDDAESAIEDLDKKYSYLDIGDFRHNGHKHSFISDTIRNSLQHLMVKDNYLPKNIVINRKLTLSHPERNRNIHDLASVLNSLEVKGHKFSSVYLEDLTLAQQIQYFFNAEKIISIHGSGLVWLNFCRENTKVIEILSPCFRTQDYLKQDFWIIGNHRNLNYKSLYIEKIIGDSSSAYHYDVVINPNTLLELL
jgi:hypothetical protein